MDNLLRTGVLTGPFGTMLLTACSEDGGFADWQPSFSRGFSGASDVGTPPANAGDVGSTSGLGRPLEKEMPTPSSIIAWKISWTEKPAGLQSMGSQESATTEQLTATPLSNHTHTPVSFYIYGSNAFVCLQPIDSDALSLEGWGPVLPAVAPTDISPAEPRLRLDQPLWFSAALQDIAQQPPSRSFEEASCITSRTCRAQAVPGPTWQAGGCRWGERERERPPGVLPSLAGQGPGFLTFTLFLVNLKQKSGSESVGRKESIRIDGPLSRSPEAF